MSLLVLIVVVMLILIGLWAVNKYAPHDPPLHLIGIAILLIVLILVILKVAGVFPGSDVRIN